jgi:hypothetical protein
LSAAELRQLLVLLLSVLLAAVSDQNTPTVKDL